jgi:hypothetical protein
LLSQKYMREIARKHTFIENLCYIYSLDWLRNNTEMTTLWHNDKEVEFGATGLLLVFFGLYIVATHFYLSALLLLNY